MQFTTRLNPIMSMLLSTMVNRLVRNPHSLGCPQGLYTLVHTQHPWAGGHLEGVVHTQHPWAGGHLEGVVHTQHPWAGDWYSPIMCLLYTWYVPTVVCSIRNIHYVSVVHIFPLNKFWSVTAVWWNLVISAPLL